MLLKSFLSLSSKIKPVMTNVLVPKLIPIGNSSEKDAVEYLRSGSVIAVPTDTVYGLACDATNSAAIDKLYSVKDRHREKPLAVCLGDVTDVKKIACVGHLPLGLLSALLPGPVTLILSCTNSGLDKSLTLKGKIGVRIPDFFFIRQIARGLQRPLALTSANLSNEPSAVEVAEFSVIWDKLDAVFDGGYLGLNHRASTIVDLSQPDLYYIVREGVAFEHTVNVLKRFGLRET